MEKEALITVILNDLKEVETLVRTFNSPKQLNKALYKLTLQKIASIKQEIELLEDIDQLSDTPSPERNKIQQPSLKSDTETAIIEIEEESQTIPPIEAIKQSDENPIAQVQAKADEKPVEIATPQATPEIKPTVPDHEPLAHQSSKQEHKTVAIGETIGKEKTSLADKMGNASADTSGILLKSKPVDDIKKAIGINDRFLFQRELFEGKESLMNQTINELNQLENYDAAESFLKSNFDWDFQSESADTFLKIVRRKFVSQ